MHRSAPAFGGGSIQGQRRASGGRAGAVNVPGHIAAQHGAARTRAATRSAPHTHTHTTQGAHVPD